MSEYRQYIANCLLKFATTVEWHWGFEPYRALAECFEIAATQGIEAAHRQLLALVDGLEQRAVEEAVTVSADNGDDGAMSEQLTPERLAELRRIAEAATPGPWRWRHKSRTLHTQSNRQAPYSYGSVIMWQETTVDGDREIEAKEADFDYIERMDPSTALAMLYEIGRLRGEREVLAEAVRADHKLLTMLDLHNEDTDLHCCNVEVCDRVLELWRAAHVKRREALALLDGEKGGGGE